MLLKGRAAMSAFTTGAVMAGAASSTCSVAVFASTTPSDFPTCADADEPTSRNAATMHGPAKAGHYGLSHCVLLKYA